jgi:hypothetical protein
MDFRVSNRLPNIFRLCLGDGLGISIVLLKVFTSLIELEVLQLAFCSLTPLCYSGRDLESVS